MYNLSASTRAVKWTASSTRPQNRRSHGSSRLAQLLFGQILEILTPAIVVHLTQNHSPPLQSLSTRPSKAHCPLLTLWPMTIRVVWTWTFGKKSKVSKNWHLNFVKMAGKLQNHKNASSTSVVDYPWEKISKFSVHEFTASPIVCQCFYLFSFKLNIFPPFTISW